MASYSAFQKIVDEAGDLHLVDYRPAVSQAFGAVKVPMVLEIVQDYCQDIFAVEEHVFHELQRLQKDKKLTTFLDTLPRVRYITCKHPEVQDWLDSIYRLLLYTDYYYPDFGLSIYVWSWLFAPVTGKDYFCVRPFCRLRDPPECICGRPLIF